MAHQYSDAVRDAQNDQAETTIGTAPYLQIYSGAKPANCAAADPSGLLCEFQLPSDWMAASSGGVKAKAGTWSGTASAGGTAASFRIKNTAKTVCGIQGTVTASGGGGDMTLDNAVIANGQAVTINTFSLTRGNG